MIDGYQDTLVKVSDIPMYMNDEFYQAMYGWTMVKKWGMPLAGGWADQPKQFIDAVDTIENAYNEWEYEQAEKDRLAQESK